VVNIRWMLEEYMPNKLAQSTDNW